MIGIICSRGQKDSRPKFDKAETYYSIYTSSFVFIVKEVSISCYPTSLMKEQEGMKIFKINSKYDYLTSLCYSILSITCKSVHLTCLRFVCVFRVKEKMNPFTLRFLERDSEFQVTHRVLLSKVSLYYSQCFLKQLKAK